MSSKTSPSSAYITAVQRLAAMDPQSSDARDLLERMGAVFSEVPALASYRWEILMAMESVLHAPNAAETLVGGPARLVESMAAENMLRASSRRRVLDEPMMEADTVARALGSHSVNLSQYASLRRRRGELLGVPIANRYLFPAFQIDVEHGRIRPGVKQVNHILDAVEDPWGAASWWFSGNARLREDRPADLIREDSMVDAVVLAARSIVAPIG